MRTVYMSINDAETLLRRDHGCCIYCCMNMAPMPTIHGGIPRLQFLEVSDIQRADITNTVCCCEFHANIAVGTWDSTELRKIRAQMQVRGRRYIEDRYGNSRRHRFTRIERIKNAARDWLLGMEEKQ